jgi:hypothetical protein
LVICGLAGASARFSAERGLIQHDRNVLWTANALALEGDAKNHRRSWCRAPNNCLEVMPLSYVGKPTYQVRARRPTAAQKPEGKIEAQAAA